MSKTRNPRIPWKTLLPIALLIIALLVWPAVNREINGPTVLDGTATVEDLPPYSGEAFVILDGNVPRFHADNATVNSYEEYSPLDDLGRCGMAEACIGMDLMPTEERQPISHIYPSGWNNKPYDFVDGQYLYNRCHLIGFQLTGENDNERNLITGTRYMNTQGMLPFENMVADYIKETDNHVMYRVTPIYDGDNLVASGVQMEGYSVEDGGEGVSFHVFCYNVQPDVVIDYATGDNHEADAEDVPPNGDAEQALVLNTSSKRIHRADCTSVDTIREENRREVTGTVSEWTAQGYSPCGACLSE